MYNYPLPTTLYGTGNPYEVLGTPLNPVAVDCPPNYVIGQTTILRNASGNLVVGQCVSAAPSSIAGVTIYGTPFGLYAPFP
jgi:hypothetical protein